MRLAPGRTAVITAIAALLFLTGCRDRARTRQAATELQHILAGKPLPSVAPAVWTNVREFYARHGGTPVWLTFTRPSKAAEVLTTLRMASAHGLDADDYGAPEIARLLDEWQRSDPKAPDRVQRLAEIDARLTMALFALGHDVAQGQTKPTTIDRRWRARRDPPDLVGTLETAMTGDAKTWLTTIQPSHPEYVALQRVLSDLNAQQVNGGWPVVPAARFKKGTSHQAVMILRRRLTASGNLRGAAAAITSSTFDGDVEAAVRTFQEHHALKATGVPDAATLAAMNVPLDVRIRQIELNLERWRWVGDDFGSRYLLVNIPSYHLGVYESDRLVRQIRVVVGKRGNETPIFSSQMSTVVFSPYWHIPETIVAGETAPATARDPDYLSRHQIEVLRVSDAGATPVDPSTVDWNDQDGLRGLAFRQRPGATNALGHVKFLFPNPFDVYLHDTPSDGLFARPGRALSHGCVRVEEPEALAHYVLRGRPEWDEPRILQAMNRGVEKPVTLKQSIPVHIVYFTTAVDAAGGLHFYPDVYGYDSRQAEARHAARSRAAARGRRERAGPTAAL